MVKYRKFRAITAGIFLLIILNSLTSIFAVSVCAADDDVDWRIIGSTPKLSFRDLQGNIIPELENIPADSLDLQFDSSYVSYSDEKEQRYGSVDILFSYADYSYSVDINEYNLPDSERMVAEMKYGNQIFTVDEIICSTTSKQYLKVDLYFEKINFYDEFSNEFELFIQYFRKNQDGDEENIPSKGSVLYVFDRMNSDDETLEEEDKLNIQLVLPETEEQIPDDTTPYILVDECVIEDGWEAVSAGRHFTVNLTCRNSHDQIDLENILLQVDVPADMKLEHPSDTFYIGNVGDKERFQYSLNFSTLYGANLKNYDVTLKFSYEYIDGDKRKSDNITTKIQIPVYQTMRFIVDPLCTFPAYEVNETHELASTFANMSRGNIYNVTATLITDAICGQKVQHLGNLSAGEGGAAIFKISSQKEGFENAGVCYTYESENGQTEEMTVSCLLKFVQSEDDATEQEVVKYITDISSVESQSSKMQLYLIIFLMMFIAGVLGYAIKRADK